MLAEPRGAGGPHPIDVVDRRGAEPEVGVVMKHPPAAAVHLFRGARAADAQIVDHVPERGATLGDVGDLAGPVVHLEVDVGRVLAFPRRVEQLVPHALEIGGLRAGTTRGDEHVPAVLEEECCESRIGVEPAFDGVGDRRVLAAGAAGIAGFTDAAEALVRGKIGGIGAPEIECDAAEEFLEVGDVGSLERVVVLPVELCEILLAASGGVGGDVLETDEVRRRDEQKGRSVGVAHLDLIAVALRAAACCEHAQARLEFHPRLVAGNGVEDLSLHDQRVVAGRLGGGRRVRALRADVEAELAGLVGGDTDDDDVVGITCENLATEGDVTGFVRHGRHGCS